MKPGRCSGFSLCSYIHTLGSAVWSFIDTSRPLNQVENGAQIPKIGGAVYTLFCLENGRLFVLQLAGSALAEPPPGKSHQRQSTYNRQRSHRMVCHQVGRSRPQLHHQKS